MKIRSLFELVSDSKDIADFFENVESPEQMVSALERIKKREVVDFLTCIQTLRISLEQLVEDTLEMSGFEPEEDEEELEIGDLGLEDETTNPLESPTTPNDESPK